jgi:HK97 family phage major capsid protein
MTTPTTTGFNGARTLLGVRRDFFDDPALAESRGLGDMDYREGLIAAERAHSARMAELRSTTGGQLRASEQRTYDRHAEAAAELGAEIRRLDDEAGAMFGRALPTYGGAPSARRSPFLAPTERMVDRLPQGGRDELGTGTSRSGVSLGLLLRGYFTGQWNGADNELRAMGEGVSTAGGVLVPTPTAAEFIDRARNAARVVQAGATTVPMDAETLKVPRLTGSSAPAWREEHGAIAIGDLTLDSVTLKAKSLAFIVKTSRELLEDSDPAVAPIIEADLAAQVGLEVDRVALRGSGVDPEPEGIANASGITEIAHGGANGASPDWDLYVDMQAAIRGANFEPGAVIHSSRTEASLGKLREGDGTGQYLRPPAALDGVRRLSTNQLPGNLTTGTSTDTSEVYMAEWSRLYLGIRTGPLMFTLSERYAENGQVAFLVWWRGDIALAQPGAFAVATGVRP